MATPTAARASQTSTSASTPSASRASPRYREQRKAPRRVSAAATRSSCSRASFATAAACSFSSSSSAETAPDTVVLDGANLAWTFSASLFAKHGCRTRLPLSRGLTLALESDVWRDLGVTPVAFMPESYVEGPLHGLADGGTLETLVPGNVTYLGDGTWRNVVLWRLTERGALVAVPRPAGARDADDKRIIAYAREREALICSNDRYEDHVAGAKAVASGSGSKDLRRWLRRNRSGYEFSVGTPEDAAYEAGKPAVARPPVGCAHLPPPPEGEAGATGTGWRAEVHAPGSSRPWALGLDRWGRDKKGARSGRGKRRRRQSLGHPGGGRRRGEGAYKPGKSDSETDDPEFPFWAMPDEDLPVTFRLKR